jgi:hypothetical protein
MCLFLCSDLGAVWLTQPLPMPTIALPTVSHGLRRDIDWVSAQATYARERLVVIDDLLAPDALHVLQAYARHGAHFRTMRRGFLGKPPFF